MVKKVVSSSNENSDSETTDSFLEEKTSKKSGDAKMSAAQREEILIENFVGLQHAMTNLSIKFGMLSDNISMLLKVFEESAKVAMQGGKPDEKELMRRLDSLIDQNKTIARGLVLMEGKLNAGPQVSEVRPPAQRPSMMQPSQAFQQSPPPNRPRPLPSI